MKPPHSRPGGQSNLEGKRSGQGALLLTAALLLAAPLPPASAQTLDEIQVEAVKSDAVIRIKFNGRVRYIRQSPTASSPTDLLQVTFQVISLDDPAAVSLVEEAKVSPVDAPGPAFTVVYPPQQNHVMRVLTVRFNNKVSAQVRAGAGDRVIEVVIKNAARLQPGIAAPAPAAAVAPVAGNAATGADTGMPVTGTPASASRTLVDAFAITLQQFSGKDSGAPVALPAGFERYSLFNVPLSGKDGGYEVNLGYFPDANAAEAARQSLLASFPQAVVFDAEQRKQQNLNSAAAAPVNNANGPVDSTTPAPTAGAPTEVSPIDAKAEDLLVAAADAVSAKNYGGAIDLLNQVLLLPPNASSQTAQELIGVARERSDEIAKARTEYELYLKLFPTGEGADRVRQRLANLGGAPVAPVVVAAPAAADGTPAQAASADAQSAPRKTPNVVQKSITGAISQFYYGGQTRTQTLLNVPTGINQTTLTGVTQSALVTNLDATARYRDADSDSRMVLRDTNTASFLTGGHGSNQLTAAYVDYKDLVSTLGVRAGRQSGASAGAIGLFDGISVGYSITPRIRANVSVGQPSDPITAPHQRFEGFDVQVDEVLPGVGVGVYGINQTVDGVVSRRALGLEGRYFSPHYSLYAASDYDTSFKATNSTVIQGTATTDDQQVLTVLFDHRRIPNLDIGNALIGSNFTSLQDMLNQLGYAQVQQLAAQVAAVSRQAVVSYSRPVTEHWQASTDVRWSDIGALPAIGLAPAQPGTGSQMSYSLVATGSNLYSQRDTNVLNMTVLNSAQLHGAQLAYNNLTAVMQNQLSLEPSIRLYVQNDNLGLHTTRITPGMRASYRLTQVASIETEAILELSKVTGPTSNEDAKNAFYYVGYRYDFR